MRTRGLRVEVDDSDDRMQKKIRNAQLQKVPFMVIAGDDDVEAGAVSFRYRDGHQENGVRSRRPSPGSPPPWSRASRSEPHGSCAPGRVMARLGTRPAVGPGPGRRLAWGACSGHSDVASRRARRAQPVWEVARRRGPLAASGPPTVDSVERPRPTDRSPSARETKVGQPRLADRRTWRVTELVEGRSFTWEAAGPGMRTIARHEVGPRLRRVARSCSASSSTGPMGAVAALVWRRLTQRYVELEAASLDGHVGPPGGRPASC